MSADPWQLNHRKITSRLIYEVEVSIRLVPLSCWMAKRAGQSFLALLARQHSLKG
jgi:hypothetical protein